MSNEITVKQCPFMQDTCVMDECQLWFESEDQCAVVVAVYLLGRIKEDSEKITRFN